MEKARVKRILNVINERLFENMFWRRKCFGMNIIQTQII